MKTFHFRLYEAYLFPFAPSSERFTELSPFFQTDPLSYFLRKSNTPNNACRFPFTIPFAPFIGFSTSTLEYQWGRGDSSILNPTFLPRDRRVGRREKRWTKKRKNKRIAFSFQKLFEI